MRRDHPRIRGEHCISFKYSSASAGSPPHTRGTLFVALCVVFDVGITPAYAGNTPAQKETSQKSWDHPRIRGEHALCEWYVDRIRGSPPHTRGTQYISKPAKYKEGITPAYAGNTQIVLLQYCF